MHYSRNDKIAALKLFEKALVKRLEHPPTPGDYRENLADIKNRELLDIVRQLQHEQRLSVDVIDYAHKIVSNYNLETGTPLAWSCPLCGEIHDKALSVLNFCRHCRRGPFHVTNGNAQIINGINYGPPRQVRKVEPCPPALN